jgi:hypothetical protein
LIYFSSKKLDFLVFLHLISLYVAATAASGSTTTPNPKKNPRI